MNTKVYLMLADGMSVHTYKWAKEIKKYVDLYVFSVNGSSKALRILLGDNHVIEDNICVDAGGANVSALRIVRKLIPLINRLNPVIINAHYITSYGTLAILAATLTAYKGKIILSTWGSDVLVTPYKNKWYYYLTKFLLKRADMVTSDSLYMTENIQQIYKFAKVMTFPMGVEDIPNVSEDEKMDDLIFSNRGLEKNYNIDKVLKIFYTMVGKNRNLKLVVANDGSQRNRLEKLMETLNLQNNVKFVGYLNAEQQSMFYRYSRYFISLPTSDSTSVSLLEAMSYGCIPIVSDIYANREWIVNGENGVIVKNEKNIDLHHLRKTDIFLKNREIIRKKAIWRDNVAEFIRVINN